MVSTIYMYYRSRMQRKSSKSKKLIAFIRHGLAEHNVLFNSNRSKEARSILDPKLVGEGIQQARQVVDHPLLKQFLEKDTLLVVSPLSRTVLTAWTILKHHCAKTEQLKRLREISEDMVLEQV